MKRSVQTVSLVSVVHLVAAVERMAYATRETGHVNVEMVSMVLCARFLAQPVTSARLVRLVSAVTEPAVIR